MLADYTTYESVRVTLGLTIKELPDALLDAEIYDLNLETEVYGIGSDIPTLYTVAATESTDVAEAFVRAVRMFSTYCVANQCTEALPLFSTKGYTDGKAGVYRDGNSPYKGTIDRVHATYLETRRVLQERYATYSESDIADQTPITLMGISSPSFDPVTGS